MVYTMCLPQEVTGSSNLIASQESESSQGFTALRDLEAAREEVIRAVHSAPKRRVLNEISRLSDAASLLKVHYTVLHSMCIQYQKEVACSLLF